MGSRTFYQTLSVFLGLGLIVLLALPSGPVEQRSRHEERRARLAGRSVHLVSHSARVKVRPSVSDELIAVADLRLESRDDRWLDFASTHFDLKLEERGDIVELSLPDAWADYHRPRGGFLSFDFDHEYSLDLEIAVPKGTTLVLNNRYGDVDVAEIEGRLEVQLKSGDIAASRVRGGARIEQTYGDLVLRNVEGDLDLRGKSGSVSIRELEGAARVEHAYGKVELSQVRGPIQVEVYSGGLSIARAESSVTVTSRYSEVDIDGLGGALVVDNESGGVKVRGLSPAAWASQHRIASRYGGIEVIWPSTAPHPALDLKTSYGILECALPGTASEQEGHAVFSAPADAANPDGLLALAATSGDLVVRRE